MPDNKKKRKPRDAKRINMNENYEVRYWVKALNTTKEALGTAVKKVGVMISDVRTQLASKRIKKAS